MPRDPTVRGPWGVGVTTIGAVDRSGTSLVVEVWYPATPDDDAERETTLGIPTSSVRDAPADPRGGPFPLVAFSHGAGGVRVQSVYLTEHLASWGYIVVAPDHPRDTLGSSSEHRPEVFRARPHQIKASIDAALDFDVDTSRIAAAGHSFGAFTTLVLAGARVDIGALREACATDPEQLVCGGFDEALTQDIVDEFADPRITAGVALAPAGNVAFGSSGLQAVGAPVQFQAGTADTLATTDEVRAMYTATPRAHTFVEITRAAHFSFTDICVLYELSGGASGPLGFLATQGCGTDTLPIERAHAASRTLAAAFLDQQLYGVVGDLPAVADAVTR